MNLFKQLCLIVLVSLFTACHEQELPTKERTEDFILLQNDAHFEGLVSSLKGNTNQRTATNYLNAVDLSRAITWYDSATAATFYSANLVTDVPSIKTSFLLSENEAGEVNGLIIEYILDVDWYNSLDEFPGWNAYNGQLKIRSMEGAVLYSTEIENGATKKLSNQRLSSYTCVTYNTVVGQTCAGPGGQEVCYPVYEMVTECFPTGSEGGGGTINMADHAWQTLPKRAILEVDYVLDPPGTLPKVCGDGMVSDGNGECVPKPDPCDTGNNILDSEEIQSDLLKIWSGSNANNGDIPMDERLEQGGWIIEINGGYDVVFFPPTFLRDPCGMSPPSNWKDLIPDNIVGYVHSHPFYIGENTMGPCGTGGETSYKGGPSRPDYVFLTELMNHLSNFSIKGYVIDGNKIYSYDYRYSIGIVKYNRCGY
jgi:hypothetical protein